MNTEVYFHSQSVSIKMPKKIKQPIGTRLQLATFTETIAILRRTIENPDYQLKISITPAINAFWDNNVSIFLVLPQLGTTLAAPMGLPQNPEKEQLQIRGVIKLADLALSFTPHCRYQE